MEIKNQLNNLCILKIQYVNKKYIIDYEVLDSCNYVKKLTIEYKNNETIVKVKFTKFKFLRYKRSFFEIKTEETSKITFKSF